MVIFIALIISIAI